MATSATSESMHHLRAFQRDLLVVLDKLNDGDHETSGLDVRKHMSDLYDEEINHGRLYPNLDELVELGLVEKGSQDRRTNYYALTGRGERELNAHRNWIGA